MGFSRQEYWSGLPFAPPGHLPNPGIQLKSLMSPALAGGFFTTSATGREREREPGESFNDLTRPCVYNILFPGSESLSGAHSQREENWTLRFEKRGIKEFVVIKRQLAVRT